MTNRHWRELVEIVGVVGIVASMILVASQLRQSNDIAAAQAEQQLAANFNVINSARATDPEFAKLFPKLEAPESHLITATDASQIRGIAWHIVKNQSAVHKAFKNDLISRKSRDRYVVELAYILDAWPGIRPHLVEIYEQHETLHGQAVFKPIESFVAPRVTELPENAAE
ncbi:MAG: hypothetical protein ACR2QS_00630 [Woeseiaceae bacterium]